MFEGKTFSTPEIVPGFVDPVADSQSVFRVVLDAMAHPGRICELPERVSIGKGHGQSRGLSDAAAAIALTLCDFETPIWLDEPSRPARPFLKFHCGAPDARTPRESRFAFASAPHQAPALTQLDLGSPDYPERSTTLIVEVSTLETGSGLTLRGAGIRDVSRLRLDGIDPSFWCEREALAELFPLGIDLVFTCARRLVAIPRSTIVEM